MLLKNINWTGKGQPLVRTAYIFALPGAMAGVIGMQTDNPLFATGIAMGQMAAAAACMTGLSISHICGRTISPRKASALIAAVQIAAACPGAYFMKNNAPTEQQRIYTAHMIEYCAKEKQDLDALIAARPNPVSLNPMQEYCLSI